MQVADNKAVSIHYTLTDDGGEVLDSSIGNEALVYLHGKGNIIAGLEQALHGKSAGDAFNVRIEPIDAYGEFMEERIQTVPRALFQGVDELEVGMQFHADVGIITIINIDGDDITIDGNHPLAGQALTFAVEVVAVRDATADELAHGHVHGAGCDHH